MKIPTQKGEHSCKCTELSLEWKEVIVITFIPISTCATSVLNTSNTFLTKTTAAASQQNRHPVLFIHNILKYNITSPNKTYVQLYTYRHKPRVHHMCRKKKQHNVSLHNIRLMCSKTYQNTEFSDLIPCCKQRLQIFNVAIHRWLASSCTHCWKIVPFPLNLALIMHFLFLHFSCFGDNLINWFPEKSDKGP